MVAVYNLIINLLLTLAKGLGFVGAILVSPVVVRRPHQDLLFVEINVLPIRNVNKVIQTRCVPQLEYVSVKLVQEVLLLEPIVLVLSQMYNNVVSHVDF